MLQIVKDESEKSLLYGPLSPDDYPLVLTDERLLQRTPKTCAPLPLTHSG
jgi:hypothetical protein